MSSLIYIICDSDYARGYAIANYHIQGATTLMISSTPYREHLALINNLSDEIVQNQWEGKSYVGVLSWRANKRMVLPDFPQVITLALASNADVVALFCPTTPPAPHPHFNELWALLCSRLGYTQAQYESSDIPLFLYNDWLATPEWMSQYIEHIQEAYTVIETAEFQNKLEQSTAVVGNKVVRLDPACILNKLPCLFFWANNANVTLQRLL